MEYRYYFETHGNIDGLPGRRSSKAQDKAIIVLFTKPSTSFLGIIKKKLEEENSRCH